MNSTNASSLLSLLRLSPRERSTRVCESRVRVTAYHSIPTPSPVRRHECRPTTSPEGRGERGFTLLEVMVAIAILGTALVSLLSLHHQSMQSVIRAQEMTRASMLAQAVMTEAELERFPDLGRSTGDFQSSFPGQFQDFRWERIVEASANFPDVREVKIFVRYGPGQSRSFALVEFLHSPIPPDPNTGRFE